MKNLRLHGELKKELEKFNIRLRDKTYDLMRIIADGERIGMPRSRPMPSIEKGVHELRLKDISGQYRFFYYVKLENDILFFHFFKKKEQKTSKKEIELARKRLKNMKERYLYERK